MRNQSDRIIIDSNIWISFLLTRDYLKFDKIIADAELILIFSQELVDEFVEVTQRNKFKKYFDIEDVENLLLKIKNRAVIVDVKSKVAACRDPKDDFLLSLAIDGKATHIITGDKDLLALKKYEKTKILTMTEYLSNK
jgi:putative PIN family toxin of toxin-antitoxin system